MNCVKHNDAPGVALCDQCGVGLCGECVQNALRVENRPWCDQCVVADTQAYKQNLEAAIKAFKRKRIIWTVILVLGLVFLLLPSGEFIERVLVCLFFWGLGGFFTRLEKAQIARQNQDTQTAIHNAMLDRDLERSGAIWVVWAFKYAWFFVRACFFPLVYIWVVFIQGTKELEAEIARCDEMIATYSNR